MENAIYSAATAMVDAIKLVKKPRVVMRNGYYARQFVVHALRHVLPQMARLA
jgi:hypothetical protein